MHRGLSPRCLKVGEEIKRALALLFQEIGTLDPSLEGTLVTITEVQMSTDVKTAKVFLLPLGGKKSPEILSFLNESKPQVRKMLAKKVYLKYVPELIFTLDQTFEEGDQISRILNTESVQKDIHSDEE